MGDTLMLSEVAITPEIFLQEDAEAAERRDVFFYFLKAALLDDTILRNLYAGYLRVFLEESKCPISPKWNRLLKALSLSGRLYSDSVSRVDCKSSALDEGIEWLEKALQAHKQERLDCIITSIDTKKSNNKKERKEHGKLIWLYERFYNSEWWGNRKCSVRLPRKTESYIEHLDRILRCSSSLMFIDPHLDPSKPNYKEFYKLLIHAGTKHDAASNPPEIEIHRKGYGFSKPSGEKWEEIFCKHLKPKIVDIPIKVKVFIWDKFHDRYLISNLMGISIPNGFDIDINIGNEKNNWTTWTRLDRRDAGKKRNKKEDSDNIKEACDVAREFDKVCNPHKFRYCFELLP